MALPINSDLGWSAWLHGYSVSMWLRIERKNNLCRSTSVVNVPSSQVVDSLNNSFSDWDISDRDSK